MKLGWAMYSDLFTIDKLFLKEYFKLSSSKVKVGVGMSVLLFNGPFADG